MANSVTVDWAKVYSQLGSSGSSKEDLRDQQLLALDFFHTDVFPTLGKIVPDDIENEFTPSSGSGASAYTYGASKLNQYLNKEQTVYLFGYGEKAGIGEAFYRATPAQKQEMASKDSNIRAKLTEVSLGILASERAAHEALSVARTLESTPLASTQEGRDKIKKSIYAIGTGIILGEDAMHDRAKALGINLNDNAAISNIAAASMEDEDPIATLAYKQGLLSFVQNNPGQNYKFLIGNDKGDPYLRARTLSLGKDNSAKFTESMYENEYTYVKPGTSGKVLLRAATDSLTGIGYLYRKLFSGGTDMVSGNMRNAMIDEAMYEGDFGRSMPLVSSAIQIGGTIAEMALLSYLTGVLAASGVGAPAAAVTGAGVAVKGAKTASLMKRVFSGLKIAKMAKTVAKAPKAVVATAAAAKVYQRAATEGGYGFTTGYDWKGDGWEKLAAEAAFTAGTMYASLGFSEKVSRSFGANKLIGSAAKSFAYKDANAFINKLAMESIVAPTTDLVVDMAMDFGAHAAIESLMSIGGGKDPFTVQQEMMTSAMGDVSATGSGVLQQLGYRAAARVGGRIMNRWFAPKVPDVAKIGSKSWAKDVADAMGDTKFNDAPFSRAMLRLNNKLFNSSLQNVVELGKTIRPLNEQQPLFKLLSERADPVKTYLALWKMQEMQVNDAYRNLTTRAGRQSIADEFDNIQKIAAGDPGLKNVTPILDAVFRASVRYVNTEDELHALLGASRDYIFDGTDKDQDKSSAGLSRRFNEVASLITTKVAIQNPDIRNVARDTFIATLGRKISDIAQDPNVDETYKKSVSTFASSYRNESPNVNESTIPLEEHLLTKHNLDGQLSFRISKDNAQAFKDLYSEVSSNERRMAEQRSSDLDAERKAAEAVIADINAPENERIRMKGVIDNINKYQESLRADRAEGINDVADFLKKHVETGDIIDVINGDKTISGTMITDAVGAAQALIRIYSSAIGNELKTGRTGATRSATEDIDAERAASIVSRFVYPLHRILVTFYPNVSDEHKAMARRVLGVAIKELGKPSPQISGYIGKIIEHLDQDDKLIMNRRMVTSALSAADEAMKMIRTSKLFNNPSVATKLSIALNVNVDESGIEIKDDTGNILTKYNDTDLGELLYRVASSEFGDAEDNVDNLKRLLASGATRVISGIALEHMAADSYDPNAVVKLANEKIKEIFMDNDRDTAPVEIVGFSIDNNKPSVVVSFKNMPTNVDSIKRYTNSIVTSLGKRSGVHDIARKSFGIAAVNYDLQRFERVDGKWDNILDVYDTIVKDYPGIFDAVKTEVSARYAEKDPDLNIILGRVKDLLYSQSAGLMNKYKSKYVDAIAYKLVMKSLIMQDTNLNVSFNVDGRPVLNLGSTKPMMVTCQDCRVVDGTNMTSEEEAELENLGFMRILSKGANRTPVWVMLSSRYREFNYEYILNTLTKQFKESFESYAYGKYTGENTFEYRAYKGLSGLLKEYGNGASPLGTKDQLGKIVDTLANAYNETVVSKTNLPDEMDTSVEFISKDGTIVTKTYRQVIDEFDKSIMPGLSYDIGLMNTKLKTFVDMLPSLQDAATTAPDELATKLNPIISETSELLTRGGIDSTTLTDSFNGIVDEFARMTTGIGVDVGRLKSSLGDLESKFKGIVNEYQQKSLNELTRLRTQESLRKFTVENISNQDSVKLARDIVESLGLKPAIQDNDISTSREADLYNSMSKAITKAASMEVSKSDVAGFKMENNQQTFANIIGIVNTRGMLFNMSPTEVAKRFSGFQLGSSMKTSDALVLYETMLTNVNAVRQRNGLDPLSALNVRVELKDNGDGSNAASAIWLHAMANYYGQDPSVYGKYILSLGGGLGKINYSALSNWCEDDGTITIKLDVPSLKKLAAEDVEFFKKAFDNNMSMILDKDEVIRFIKGHRLHSDTFSKLKPSGWMPSQLDIFSPISMAVRNSNIQSAGSMAHLVDNTVSFGRNIYSAYDKGRKFNNTPVLAITATGTSDLTGDTVPAVSLLDASATEWLAPSFENMRSMGLQAQARVEIGLVTLANMANGMRKYVNLPDGVQAAIDNVYSRVNSKENMSNVDVKNNAVILLDFLTNDKLLGGIGQHIFKAPYEYEANGVKQTGEGYFIALSRSPQEDEATGFRLLTGVLNVSNGAQIALNNAAQKLVGGDFDGDMTLGLPFIKPVEYAKALSLATGKSVKTIMDRLGNEILEAEARYIDSDNKISMFSLRPIILEDTLNQTPLDNTDYMPGQIAITGAIKMYEDILRIANIIRYSNNVDVGGRIKNALHNLRETYRKDSMVIANNNEYWEELETIMLSGKSIDNRLAFLKGVSGPTISNTLFGAQAVGSVKHHYTSDYVKGPDGDPKRKFMVIESIGQDNKSMFATVLVEVPVEKFGMLKLVSAHVGGASSLSEEINEAHKLSVRTYDEIIKDDSMTVRFDDNYYLSSPGAMFKQISDSMTTPKDMQALIQKYYPSDPSGFVNDTRSFASGVMAATMFDIGLFVDRGKIKYAMPSLKYKSSSGNPDSDVTLKENWDFQMDAAYKAVSIVKTIYEDNVMLLNKAAKAAVGPDNNISLEEQAEIRRSLIGAVGLKSDVQRWLSITEGWKYNFPGLSHISLEWITDNMNNIVSLMDPGMNITKLNFWRDLENVLFSIDDIFKAANNMDAASLDAFGARLNKDKLYFESRNDNMDLSRIVRDKLIEEHINYTKKDIDTMLNKLDLEIGKGERISVPDMNRSIAEISLIQLDKKANFKEYLLSPLIDSKKNGVTTFSLAKKLSQLIPQYDLRKNEVERVKLVKVFETVISLLHPNSRIKATWAAEGLTHETFNKITDLFKSGQAELHASGSWKINPEAIYTVVGVKEGEPIESSYKIVKEFDALVKMRKIGFISDVKSRAFKDYAPTGEC